MGEITASLRHCFTVHSSERELLLLLLGATLAGLGAELGAEGRDLLAVVGAKLCGRLGLAGPGTELLRPGPRLLLLLAARAVLDGPGPRAPAGEPRAELLDCRTVSALPSRLIRTVARPPSPPRPRPRLPEVAARHLDTQSKGLEVLLGESSAAGPARPAARSSRGRPHRPTAAAVNILVNATIVYLAAWAGMPGPGRCCPVCSAWLCRMA